MLCLGVHSLPGGALTTFPCKFGLNFFLRPGGVHVHPVHPLATPMRTDLGGSLSKIYGTHFDILQ